MVLKNGYIHRSYENFHKLIDGKQRFYAEVAHKDGYPYMRIELTDAQRNMAYVNPMYFN